MSAKELSNELDADVSTIYRRVDKMVEYDLLVERTRVVEDGSHHSIYDKNVNHVDIDITDGEIIVDIEEQESAAKRFSSIWDGIRDT